MEQTFDKEKANIFLECCLNYKMIFRELDNYFNEHEQINNPSELIQLIHNIKVRKYEGNEHLIDILNDERIKEIFRTIIKIFPIFDSMTKGYYEQKSKLGEYEEPI